MNFPRLETRSRAFDNSGTREDKRVSIEGKRARPLPPLEFFHERRLKFFLDSVLEFEKFTNRKQNEFQAVCFIFHVLEFQATSSYIRFFFFLIISYLSFLSLIRAVEFL